MQPTRQAIFSAPQPMRLPTMMQRPKRQLITAPIFSAAPYRMQACSATPRLQPTPAQHPMLPRLVRRKTLQRPRLRSLASPLILPLLLASKAVRPRMRQITAQRRRRQLLDLIRVEAPLLIGMKPLLTIPALPPRSPARRLMRQRNDLAMRLLLLPELPAQARRMMVPGYQTLRNQRR